MTNETEAVRAKPSHYAVGGYVFTNKAHAEQCISLSGLGKQYPNGPLPLCLASEIARLTGEVETLNSLCIAITRDCNKANARAEAAERRVADLETDALRYRWLRDNCYINRHDGRTAPYAIVRVCIGKDERMTHWMNPGKNPCIGIPSLDLAVDTALTQPEADHG